MSMGFIEADIYSLAAFYLLLVIMLVVVLIAAERIDSFVSKGGRPGYFRVTHAVIAFVALFSLGVASGITQKFFMPAAPLLFLVTLAAAFGFSLSRFGHALAAVFSLNTLIGFQVFRVPLELILHHWAAIETIPSTMTWTGQNFDIVSGITAIVFAPFATKSRAIAWIPTIIGSLLLINVIRVVIMSSPFPFSWDLDRPLLLITRMPYALIVPLCVAPALIGHLAVLQVLVRRKID